MRTATLLLALVFGARLSAADPKPDDKPVPTKDAAAKMTVPPGFKVTLFAGEPDVVQPIAFTFDDRGRMWVVECLSYPKWTKDGTGHDRVVILEDTDGNGTFDKKTVFMDNGSNLSGIELGFGGVWLCSSPNLLFVPILDGDKPGKAEVKLDGWNMIDTKHNIFNSLVWGPDGWLYGCNGIQAKAWVGTPGTPKTQRPYMDCGVWRYHPTRKVFEPVAHGTTNPFGLDFDEYGEIFITNCVIDHLFHFVPGGHYERMYGQDANPHAYGLMKSCVDYRHWGSGAWTDSRANSDGSLKKEHSDAGGGHAHSGCAIYLGDNFPKEYRNTLFTANIHGNRLNNDGLERTKSGMKGVRRPDFLFANDPWFRGICVKTGPDGALYVSDWCDTGECHNYDKADITNGRIYRVSYGDPKQWKGDVSKLTDAELVKMQLHANDWFVRKARRVLQERAEAGKLEKGTVEALQAVLKGEKEKTKRLRAMWALAAIWRLDVEMFPGLYRDGDEHVRAWAVRLTPSVSPPVEYFDALESLAKAEASPLVCNAVASAVPNLPKVYRGFLIRSLMRNPIYLSPDEPTNLMCWYALAHTFDTQGATPDMVAQVLQLAPNSLLRRNVIRWSLGRSESFANRVLEELFGVMQTGTLPVVQAELLAAVRE